MNLDFEDAIIAIEDRIAELKRMNADPNVQFDAEIAELERQLRRKRKEVYSKLSPWETVQVARHKDRPLLVDFIPRLFSEFIELHGDRAFGDDRGLIGGFATIDGRRVMLIGFDKGKTVKEKDANNFGMAHPEGYRKALRLMKLAEKYNLPVISLIDTQGAYPGTAAEERGQAEAIARNIMEMISLEVPIIAVITGEGGSGGALGVGVGDVIMMLSNAVYSVISPEGCAAILWRDAAHADEAAEAMQLTAKSLLKLGIIDEIIDEPPGGAHREVDLVASRLKEALITHLDTLRRVSTKRLLARRFDKYTAIGRYDESKRKS
jgi:acetyl-CoA carboxylase carboxyl transferase subunit alpha